MSANTVHTTIKTLRRQLRELDRQRGKIITALSALEDLPAVSENGGPPSSPRKPRAGGSPLIDAAVTALRNSTAPMPVMDLIAAIQQNGVQSSRAPAKIRGTLVSAMLRRTDLFTKAGRGVYGLAEWGDVKR